MLNSGNLLDFWAVYRKSIFYQLVSKDFAFHSTRNYKSQLFQSSKLTPPPDDGIGLPPFGYCLTGTAPMFQGVLGAFRRTAALSTVHPASLVPAHGRSHAGSFPPGFGTAAR
jgi:hypothetical protein